MRGILAHRPSSAMAVALLALFVSLSGGAYAALVLPRNSVRTPQLRNGAVTAAKLRRGAVTARAVKPGSLVAGDFKAGQLPRGAQGAMGPQGPVGPGYQFTTASGQTLTISSPGTYFVVVSATLSEGAAGPSYGQCFVADDSAGGSTYIEGAFALPASAAAPNYTYSGLVSVTSADAQLTFYCVADSGTGPTPSAVQWWYSPAAVTAG